MQPAKHYRKPKAPPKVEASPHAPLTSWWTATSSREDFDAKAAARKQHMAASTFGAPTVRVNG